VLGIIKSVRYDRDVRSYGQYCSLAKALDVVGDRWNLLIVRELMIRGDCRYTDLMNGLPGIATNLLAERLSELEEAGIVSREQAPPPIATKLFRLTERGQRLGPAMRELGQWGVELMPETPDGHAFRSHWLALPVSLFLTDREPDRPPVRIQVRTGDEPMVIETLDGEAKVRAGTVEQPDLVLSGAPNLVLGLMAGRLSLDEARSRGLQADGDARALERVLPHSSEQASATAS
jgi:DNA-binding HxlR family transcriptional regulator